MDDSFALEEVSNNRGQHLTSLKFLYLQSSELSMVVHFRHPPGKETGYKAHWHIPHFSLLIYASSSLVLFP